MLSEDLRVDDAVSTKNLVDKIVIETSQDASEDSKENNS